jgi:hypothetical protein
MAEESTASFTCFWRMSFMPLFPSRFFAIGLATLCFSCSALANERLGIVVHRLADACVGNILEIPNGLERLARAGRTATGVCSCAAEAAVIVSKMPEGGFDAWAVDGKFKTLLATCANAGNR